MSDSKRAGALEVAAWPGNTVVRTRGAEPAEITMQGGAAHTVVADIVRIAAKRDCGTVVLQGTNGDSLVEPLRAAGLEVRIEGQGAPENRNGQPSKDSGKPTE